MAKRGVKPGEGMKPREPLSADPPKELRGRVREIYKRLAAELSIEGFAARSDWRTVALAAKIEAHLERLDDEVTKLDSLVVVNINGTTSLHPLVREQRTQRTQLAAIYNMLFLSPRARAASRLGADFRTPGQAADELGDFLA